MTERFSCTVNGSRQTGQVEPRSSLAEWLRTDLGLTGTKVGCEQGACGSCTVLVDDEPVRSCLMFAVQAADRDVRTIEGLARDGALDTLQQAILSSSSFQCGFCASGFLMSIAGQIDGLSSNSSDEDVRHVLSGNLCRCTGYASIVAGVREAVRRYEEARR